MSSPQTYIKRIKLYITSFRTLMDIIKSSTMRINFLFYLVGGLLFSRWAFLLISTDAYLFSDPTSYLFWSAGCKRLIIAALISSGLIVSATKIGRTYRIISLILLIISWGCSILVVPEKGGLILWIALTCVHSIAIFNLYFSSGVASKFRRCRGTRK
jgi:hypothetical protein